MRRYSRGALLLAMTGLFGCVTAGESYTMTGTPKLPAAEGLVKVLPVDQGKVKLLITLHMAQYNRISPEATGYVLWAKPADPLATTQNLGFFKVDDTLTANVQAVVALKDFQLFVTAEKETGLGEPTGDVLISGQIHVK